MGEEIELEAHIRFMRRAQRFVDKVGALIIALLVVAALIIVATGVVLLGIESVRHIFK